MFFSQKFVPQWAKMAKKIQKLIFFSKIMFFSQKFLPQWAKIVKNIQKLTNFLKNHVF